LVFLAESQSSKDDSSPAIVSEEIGFVNQTGRKKEKEKRKEKKSQT